MRSRLLLAALLLLLPSAACGPSGPAVVLVHASDPHLLDGKKGHETRNHFAFSDMMDVIRGGLLRTPPPRYLVVTGDFGLEVADPRFTSFAPGVVTAADSAIARRRLDEVANIVAGEINGSPFRKVFFVPGNNDVVLEDADTGAWSEIHAFTTAVQARLKRAEFHDLTACYHRADVGPAGCTARLDSPYVLVGFPTVSLKNRLDTAEFRRLMREADTVPYAAASRRRAHAQDAAHLEVLRRFRQVLSEATAGGWRAVVLTHIPDLEDPYAADQRERARAAAARRAELPSPASVPGAEAGTDTLLEAALAVQAELPPDDRPASDSLPDTTRVAAEDSLLTAPPPDAGAALDSARLSPADRDDAWNASPAVFAEWKRLMDWKRVDGLLAGHFHDTTQSRYRRPYTWSDRAGRARPVERFDRCRIFVAPPLADKNQERAAVGARGFALITLRNGEIERRLYWYDKRTRRFAAGPPDDREPGTCASAARAADQARAAGITFNPFRSSAHQITFGLSLLSALLTLFVWALGEPARRRLVAGVWAHRHVLADGLARSRISRTRRTLFGGAVGASQAGIVQLLWDNVNLVLFGLVWFVVLFVALFLTRKAIIILRGDGEMVAAGA